MSVCGAAPSFQLSETGVGGIFPSLLQVPLHVVERGEGRTLVGVSVLCVCVCVSLRSGFALLSDWEPQRLDIWSCRCMTHVKQGTWDATGTLSWQRDTTRTSYLRHQWRIITHSLQPWSGNICRLPPSVLKTSTASFQ